MRIKLPEIKCGVAICGKCGHCKPSGEDCPACKAKKRAEKPCRDMEKAHKEAGKSKLHFPKFSYPPQQEET